MGVEQKRERAERGEEKGGHATPIHPPTNLPSHTKIARGESGQLSSARCRVSTATAVALFPRHHFSPPTLFQDALLTVLPDEQDTTVFSAHGPHVGHLGPRFSKNTAMYQTKKTPNFKHVMQPGRPTPEIRPSVLIFFFNENVAPLPPPPPFFFSHPTLHPPHPKKSV